MKLAIGFDDKGVVWLEMVFIPGGTYLMGSPEDDELAYADEKPQHEVTLGGFYMGKYLVTQRQWRAVAARTELKEERDLELEPSRFTLTPEQYRNTDLELPVERVSFLDCLEFCKRLRKMTGLNFDLPDEAQWEYACRAGTTTRYYFGDELTDEQANFYGNEKCGERTTPVGMFPPNAFGLYDMHGNLCEWCYSVERIQPGEPGYDDPVELKADCEFDGAKMLENNCMMSLDDNDYKHLEKGNLTLKDTSDIFDIYTMSGGQIVWDFLTEEELAELESIQDDYTLAFLPELESTSASGVVNAQ